MRRLKRRVGQLTDERLPDKGFFPFESVNANLACPRIGSVWHGAYLNLVNAPESNLYESLPWLVKLRLQKLERVFPPAEVSPIVRSLTMLLQQASLARNNSPSSVGLRILCRNARLISITVGFCFDFF